MLGALLVSMLSGCGYHFPGGGSVLPGGGSKIAIEGFRNATQTPGLVDGIQAALESEVARRGNFAVVSASDADVVLAGTILSLDVRPVGFSQSDEALQYETVVSIAAQLRDARTERVVWQVRKLTENDSYGAVAQTVISQSSQFQEQSSLDQGDLDRLSDVQVSESQRQDALIRVYDNLARELYNSMVDNF